MVTDGFRQFSFFSLTYKTLLVRFKVPKVFTFFSCTDEYLLSANTAGEVYVWDLDRILGNQF